jgi:hypothetical protein
MLLIRTEPSAVTKALVAVYGLRLLVWQAGIDHQSTLQTWSNPICATVGITTGAAFAWLLARQWFSPAAGRPVPAWIAKLRNEDYLIWSLVGAAVTIGFAAVAAWVCAGLLGVGAQYLKGAPDSFSATVISERTILSSRAACRRQLTLLRSIDVRYFTICIEPADGRSLATMALKPYTAVTVNVEVTPLGVVVKSVEPQ